jgi:lipopolysaccharide export system permease protein
LGSLLNLFDTKNQIAMVDAALRSTISSKQLIVSKEVSMKNSKTWINRHIISLHEKFALGFACVILFFVGAPLGALIRKGGIGLPLVIAVLLFLTYHFIGIFATNSAKNGGFNPILAPWFSTLIMFPLGVFLTKRATADRGLFEFGNVLEPLKNAIKIKDKNSIDYKFLSDYKNDELINVINNYDTLGHQEEVRYKAIELLNTRGFTTKAISKSGVTISESYYTSENIKTDYNEHSKFAIVLYTIGISLLILFFVFKNNKLPSLSIPSIQLSVVALFLYMVYFIKSIKNTFQFYNHINKKQKQPNVLLLIFGIPFYFITYLYLNEKMKGDLKVNCLESLK